MQSFACVWVCIFFINALIINALILELLLLLLFSRTQTASELIVVHSSIANIMYSFIIFRLAARHQSKGPEETPSTVGSAWPKMNQFRSQRRERAILIFTPDKCCYCKYWFSNTQILSEISCMTSLQHLCLLIKANLEPGFGAFRKKPKMNHHFWLARQTQNLPARFSLDWRDSNFWSCVG